jgi:hypothetical protein
VSTVFRYYPLGFTQVCLHLFNGFSRPPINNLVVARRETRVPALFFSKSGFTRKERATLQKS